MVFLCFRWVKSVRPSPQMEMYGFFTHGTDPPLHLYSLVFFLLPNHLRQPPSPAHSAADYSVTRLSPRFLVLFGCPTTDRAPLATSLPLIGLLPAEPPADPASSPGVTTLFFHTVPSANTLVRWVNENAFAFVVQARPCPTFGRPVHLGAAPIDYSPVLLLMPFGFHLAMDTLPSGVPQVGGFRSALAVSGFRFRARLGFSIPSPSPAREALPPRLDMALLIRAPEGLQPS